jgi:hypothetical protein
VGHSSAQERSPLWIPRPEEMETSEAVAQNVQIEWSGQPILGLTRARMTLGDSMGCVDGWAKGVGKECC